LLGVSTQGLADMTRLHRNTLRNATSERLQAKLREIVKAIGAASDLTGDLDKAIYWYLNEPIAAYRYKTSAELVAEGQLDAVLAYIEDLANGATG
jgi:hypothetical protein